MDSELLRAYRENGLRLLKVVANTKMPASNHGVYDTLDDYDEHTFNDYNVGVACGKGLIVVDVDVKNGKQGDSELRHLIADFGKGYWPDTWIAYTPSGGKHYYFWGDCPNAQLGVDGSIDIQALGKYVVCPPSIINGQEYVWDSFCGPYESRFRIADAPSWLIEYVVSLKKNKQVTKQSWTAMGTAIDYTMTEIYAALRVLDPNMNRECWLRIGMGLKNLGHPDGFQVWREWSQQSEKYNHNHIIRDWNSFTPEKIGGITYRTIFEYVKMEGLLKPEFRKKENAPQITQQKFFIPVPDGDGVWGDIVKFAKELFPQQSTYPHLIAVLVLSAICQRRFRPPHNAPSNAYHILAAPPASQKSMLRKAVIDLIRAVDSTLLIGEPRSSAGFKQALKKHPSKVYMQDEALSTLVPLLENQHKNLYEADILRVFLALYGDVSALEGNENKKSEDSIELISHPRFTWLAMGVTSQLDKLFANPNFVSTGFVSRFGIWVAEDNKFTFDDYKESMKKNRDWPKEIISKIKKIANSSEIRVDDTPRFEDIFISSDEAVENFHKAIFEKYSVIADKDPENTQVYFRLRDRVLWYATLHAVGCNRLIITVDDLFMADTICDLHLENFKKFNESVDSDVYLSIRNNILEIVRKKKITKISEIQMNMKKEFRDPKFLSIKKDALKNLLAEGEVFQVDKFIQSFNA